MENIQILKHSMGDDSVRLPTGGGGGYSVNCTVGFYFGRIFLLSRYLDFRDGIKNKLYFIDDFFCFIFFINRRHFIHWNKQIQSFDFRNNITMMLSAFT